MGQSNILMGAGDTYSAPPPIVANTRRARYAPENDPNLFVGDAADTLDFGSMSEDVGRDGLSPTAAGMIGGGIQIASQIGQGIVQGQQAKQAREEYETSSMDAIAKARTQRDEDWALQKESDRQAAQEARFNERTANAGVRMQMFARDLQKEMQKYADQQQAMNNLRSMSAGSENYRDALAQRIGRV